MGEVSVLCVGPGETIERASDRLTEVSELTVIECTTRAAGRRRIHGDDIDCLVTVYDLPDGTGVELVRDIRETSPSTGCILFTNPEQAREISSGGWPLVTEYVNSESPVATDRLVELVSVTTQAGTQTAYPRPEQEDERLALLESLDLEAQFLKRALNRVAELAARQFEGDRAAVNVIEESTQKVLACHGAEWSALPREESICTYAILDEDTTVIEDTTEDPRFVDIECLAEMDIRFYAGCPIQPGGGPILGTLCLYATEPMTLSSESKECLQLLAEEAAQWFELHRYQGPEQQAGDNAEAT